MEEPPGSGLPPYFFQTGCGRISGDFLFLIFS
jgi:hypothetical protein